jgi:hypothetical protein
VGAGGVEEALATGGGAERRGVGGGAAAGEPVGDGAAAVVRGEQLDGVRAQRDAVAGSGEVGARDGDGRAAGGHREGARGPRGIGRGHRHRRDALDAVGMRGGSGHALAPRRHVGDEERRHAALGARRHRHRPLEPVAVGARALARAPVLHRDAGAPEGRGVGGEVVGA